MAAGDVISQKLIEKQESLNLKRTAKFAIFGGLYVGPAISVWFKFLDRPFGASKVLLKPWQKVLIDQVNKSLTYILLTHIYGFHA